MWGLNVSTNKFCLLDNKFYLILVKEEMQHDALHVK